MPIDREALFRTFLAESDENLRAMEEALVALEAHPDDEELLHAIFRAAHTLKGSAACVNASALVEFAHVLEELLDRMRGGKVPVLASLVTLLLSGVDVFRQLVAESAIGLGAGVASDPKLTPSLGRTKDAAPAARTLRVDVEKLDRLVNLVGEMSVARGRLRQLLERIGGRRGEEALEAQRESDRLFLDLQEQIMRVRMVPVGPIFRDYIRVVRDLAANHGKAVHLAIEGEDVEVDTAIVEHLKDPLTHMVRNALAHGIEAPAEREKAGKPRAGTIALRAFHDAGTIVIQVGDDGRGLDRQRIVTRARTLGVPGDLDRASDADVFRLVFEPGFSTAERITDLSGRGVGLDIVRRNIEALRGSVSIDSEPGRKTTITLRLPLTLAIIQGFSIGLGEQTYILPLDAVLECLDLPPEHRARRDGTAVLNVRGDALPCIWLREALRAEGEPAARESVVVVQHARGKAGLIVDQLHGESQTVIKPLGRVFHGIPGIAGSALREDGRVALILDVGALLERIERDGARPEPINV